MNSLNNWDPQDCIIEANDDFERIISKASFSQSNHMSRTSSVGNANQGAAYYGDNILRRKTSPKQSSKQNNSAENIVAKNGQRRSSSISADQVRQLGTQI